MSGVVRSFSPSDDVSWGHFRTWRSSQTMSLRRGSKVAVRWHVDAAHKGDGLGFPPSHRRVSFRGMTWLELAGGRIVSGWHSWNLGSLLQELRPPQ